MSIPTYFKTMPFFGLSFLAFSITAQPVKGFGAPKNATIVVETKDNALVLQTDKINRLFINHFGKRLAQTRAVMFNYVTTNRYFYNS